MRYVIFTSILLGSTAIAVHYFVLNYKEPIPFFPRYLTFQGSYSGGLFIEGLIVIGLGISANRYKEGVTEHHHQAIGDARDAIAPASGFRPWEPFKITKIFTKVETENDILLMVAGATLFLIALYLMWIWQI
jgi:hypothetical protein